MLHGLGAGLALLAGCSIELRDLTPDSPGPMPLPSGDFLRLAGTVNGGLTLPPAPVLGFWHPPPGPFMPLISPTAAAARGTDLFIVDAGRNAVFHYDLLRQTLRRFLVPVGQPGIRLCVLEDQTVLALDPFQRRLMRLTREGVLLSSLQDAVMLAGALDVAYDDARGIAWLNDATGGRLVAVRPALNALVPVPLQAGEAVAQVTAIAIGPDALYAIDAARRRVLRLDDQGRVLQAFGELDLKLPCALAVDRYRRVYVADALGVQVYFDGRLLVALAARALGAVEIRDLRIHGDDLAIADGSGARVHLFRVMPPGRGS